MEIAGETRLNSENSVAYINDSIGLHRVVNRDETIPRVVESRRNLPGIIGIELSEALLEATPDASS